MKKAMDLLELVEEARERVRSVPVGVHKHHTFSGDQVAQLLATLDDLEVGIRRDILGEDWEALSSVDDLERIDPCSTIHSRIRLDHVDACYALQRIRGDWFAYRAWYGDAGLRRLRANNFKFGDSEYCADFLDGLLDDLAVIDEGCRRNNCEPMSRPKGMNADISRLINELRGEKQ